MSAKLRVAVTLVSLTALAVSAGILAIERGWYDVAATNPHAPAVEAALRHAMEQSIRNHASDVQLPSGVSLEDPTLAERAAGHYSVVCADCHAAPGQPRAPWMVIYPPPADLTTAEVVDAWSDRELYWIIKHGIKDTGMTAMAPGHGDEDVWAVAAFVRQLPDLSPQRYRTMVEAFQASRSQGARTPHAEHDGAQAGH